ncbi:MAG: hypothetical protein AAF747_00750 [Planctomycetota bacterium]
MHNFRMTPRAVVLMLASGLVAPAAAQSDPAGFDTVFNIGTVPPGSIFDVPGAVTGTLIGDGDIFVGDAFVTPAFLFGDTLGSDSQLNLFDGGTIFSLFSAGPIDGSGSNVEVNISGGSVGSGFAANSGSTVNISGGSVSSGFTANSGSAVNVSGGSVGSDFDANSGSTVNISGGSVGSFFNANSASTVNISGGSVGNDANAFSGSTVNVSGGFVGNFFDANSGSTTNISGGLVGTNFDAFSGTTVNISGGSVDAGFNANSGSTVHISGGAVGSDFDAFSGSKVNVSGGTVGEMFAAFTDSTVNLFGTSFFLDGAELTELVLGEAFTIADRDVTLTGILADGSAFDFDLNTSLTDSVVFGNDFFDTNAVLTVTLVPTPGAAAALVLGGFVAARRHR